MNTPFTKLQFFQIFEDYNVSVFPAQVIISLLIILAVLFFVRGWVVRSIGLILGLLWIWTGTVYHIAFFSTINPIATAFGVLFIIEGILILFATVAGKLSFEKNDDTDSQQTLGYFLILFGLLIYPVISYIAADSILKVISVGLPCPSLIVTFGLFLLTSGRIPVVLLVIPSLWALIGTSAALTFGVYQDFMLIVSAVLTNTILLRRKGHSHAMA